MSPQLEQRCGGKRGRIQLFHHIDECRWPVCLCCCTSVCTASEFMSCRLHSSVCLSACPSTCVLFTLSVCLLLKVFASAHSKTPSSPRLLPPHLHEGDVVEKKGWQWRFLGPSVGKRKDWRSERWGREAGVTGKRRESQNMQLGVGEQEEMSRCGPMQYGNMEITLLYLCLASAFVTTAWIWPGPLAAYLLRWTCKYSSF